MHPWIARNLIYRPIQWLRQEPVSVLLKHYWQTEHYNDKEIHQAITRSFGDLLNISLKHTPAYSPCLKDTVTTQPKLHSVFNTFFLNPFPILHKTTLQKNPDLYTCTKNVGPITIETTSGSSGTPFQFPVTRLFASHFRAAMYRGHFWANKLPIGAREARIYGLPVAPSDQKKEELKDFLMNRIRLSVLDMSENKLEEFYHKLNVWKPEYLYGYVSGLVTLTEYLKAKNKTCRFKLKSIIATSEVLHAWEKELLEKYWQVRCFNEYGASELGILASECEKGSMHLNFEANILELADAIPDQFGNLTGTAVVTNLVNYKMPLVRYQLGDIVTLHNSKCTCGRQSPCISIDEGRLNQMVTTPEGKKVSGWLFYYIYRDLLSIAPGEARFQAVQTEVNHIEVHMSIREELTNQVKAVFLNHCHKHLGDSIKLSFHHVGTQPTTSSGKYMPFVSKIEASPHPHPILT